MSPFDNDSVFRPIPAHNAMLSLKSVHVTPLSVIECELCQLALGLLLLAYLALGKRTYIFHGFCAVSHDSNLELAKINRL